MDYSTYRSRYDAAYAKNARKFNLMDGGYSEDQLREAFRNYTNTEIWYWRAFKPAVLASTNIEFYEYQIREALTWAGYDYDDAQLRDWIDNYHGELKDLVKRWSRGTGMKPTTPTECKEEKHGRMDRKATGGGPQA